MTETDKIINETTDAQIAISTVEQRQSDIYQKNLSALARRDAALADRIASFQPTDSLACELTKSKDGSLNLLVNHDDASDYLHSRYNPVKEAEQLVDGVFDESRNYYIVYGLGLGYPIEELIKRTIDSDILFFIEPSLALFHQVMQARDLSGIFACDNLHWSVGETPSQAFSRWAKTYSIARLDGLGLMEIPSSRKIVGPEYMKEFNNKLKGLMVTAGGNLQTLMIMARQYQANTLFNMRFALTNPPFTSLYKKFKGKPVIIVSAGPSLDKNIDLLHEARDKALIVAVDTSLKPLRAKGIVPHLICTGDPQEANYRHLKDSADCDSFLIAEPMTNPKSFSDFKGKLFTASYGDKLVTWMENFIPKLGHVMCWGSVATMAFDVARKLGGDPIIFIGQDLSFPDGRTYAEGTYFETEEKRDMTVKSQEQSGVYSVEDIYGNEITTNRQMFAYHRWFVTEISKTRTKVINATEGGILKEGVEIMSLREALDKYCDEKFDSYRIIYDIASGFKNLDATNLKAGIDKLTKDLYEMREISKQCFESAREWLQASVKFSLLPKTIAIENMNYLEEERKKLIAKQDAFKFLEMADQIAIKRFLKGYRMINGKKIGLASYRQVLEVYIKFYASIYSTLSFQILHFESSRKYLSDYIEDSVSES